MSDLWMVPVVVDGPARFRRQWPVWALLLERIFSRPEGPETDAEVTCFVRQWFPRASRVRVGARTVPGGAVVFRVTRCGPSRRARRLVPPR
jgi:hypothetical protein